MATLAETLGSRGIQQNAVTADIQSGLKTGMQLATMEDQISQEKTKTEQMKVDLDTAKFNKAIGSLQTLARSNPQIAKKLIPRISQSMQEAGIAADPLILESIASDDEWKRRINASSALFSGMAKSEGAMQEGLSALNDFGMFEKGLQELSNQNKLEMQERAATARIGRQINTAERQIDKDQSKALTDSKIKFDASIKDDMDALKSANKAYSLVMAKGGTAGEAAKNQIARMFEKGPLTDNDLLRLGGNKSLVERGNQLVQTWTDGKITDTNRKELIEILNALRPQIHEYVRNKAARDIDSAAAAWPGIPRDRFEQVYNVEALIGAGGGAPKKDPKKAFIELAISKGASPEQASAEAAKRYGDQ